MKSHHIPSKCRPPHSIHIHITIRSPFNHHFSRFRPAFFWVTGLTPENLGRRGSRPGLGLERRLDSLLGGFGTSHCSIWGFPEVEVPRNHPFQRDFPLQTIILGVPPFMETVQREFLIIAIDGLRFFWRRKHQPAFDQEKLSSKPRRKGNSEWGYNVL